MGLRLARIGLLEEVARRLPAHHAEVAVPAAGVDDLEIAAHDVAAVDEAALEKEGRHVIDAERHPRLRSEAALALAPRDV